jgi:hypothetical protein
MLIAFTPSRPRIAPFFVADEVLARDSEAEFPRTVQTILQQALQERRYRSPQNLRLAHHLLRERDALFAFLSCPGLEARTGEPNRPSAR